MHSQDLTLDQADSLCKASGLYKYQQDPPNPVHPFYTGEEGKGWILDISRCFLKRRKLPLPQQVLAASGQEANRNSRGLEKGLLWEYPLIPRMRPSLRPGVGGRATAETSRRAGAPPGEPEASLPGFCPRSRRSAAAWAR